MLRTPLWVILLELILVVILDVQRVNEIIDRIDGTVIQELVVAEVRIDRCVRAYVQSTDYNKHQGSD